MGGFGSGRHWHRISKSVVNSFLCIDIRKWYREGLLVSGTVFNTTWVYDGELIRVVKVTVFEKHLTLSYQYRKGYNLTDANYRIEFERTRCHLGGRRVWLRCPARNCERRVAKLYGGGIFACRHCYQLVYPSQRENYGDRTSRKADKIRERLGWEPGILNNGGLKPKGMHWKTYKRLRLTHDQLVQRSLREAAIRFGTDVFDIL